MAIYSMHASMVQRSQGESAIATSAYMSRSKLSLQYQSKNGSTASSWDYSKDHDVTIAYSQIHAPENVWQNKTTSAWVFDREALWNKCELFEKREDAQVARKIMFALPCELTREQNTQLTIQFVEEYLVSRGMIVDVNIHYDNENNPHAHLVMSMREVITNRFGELDFAPTKQRDWQKKSALIYEREGLANVINEHLEKHGFLSRVSHLSHKDRGIDLEPTLHEGAARHMKDADLRMLNQEVVMRNVNRIIEKPELILEKLSINKPVFSKEDIAAAIDEVLMQDLKFTASKVKVDIDINASLAQQFLIDGDGKAHSEFINKYNIMYQKVMNSDAISIVNESDLKGRCLYAKTSRIKLEERYIDNIITLNRRKNHNFNISETDLNSELDSLNQDLNLEKRNAILRILNGSDISILEGLPGSGKTTVTGVIADLYKKRGYQVIATAPSSSAALSFSSATGIESTNLSLLRKKWVEKIGGDKFSLILHDNYFTEDVYQKDFATELTNKHVLIIDEASMVELSNMDYFISYVKRSGAKLILVGDNNQFAAVGYSGALNKATSICGSAKLEESRRQQNPIHRRATKLLGSYRIREALEIYKKDGSIIFDDTREQVIAHLVSDYIDDYLKTCKADRAAGNDAHLLKNMIICTYTNDASRILNNKVREKLKNAGVIRGDGVRVWVGKRNLELCKGEQIVFSRNFNHIKHHNSSIYNGEIGTVLSVKESNKGHYITANVKKPDDTYEKVTINTADYDKGNLLDYGYAVTGYKLQGATIDKIYALYEKMVGYEAFNVMMTRHRESVRLYADKESLIDMVYSRLNLDSKLAQDRYQITSEDLLHEIGLNISLSKRVNNNFAINYQERSSKLDANITKYIESNKKAVEIIRIISQDINIGKINQSDITKHKFWDDFTKHRKARDHAANIIVNNYTDYQEKVIQLNMNYATLEKHANVGGNYLTLMYKTSFCSNKHYQDLLNHIDNDNMSAAYDSYKSLKKASVELRVKLEDSKEELAHSKTSYQELHTAINDEIEYREKLLPEYLRRIYIDEPNHVFARWKNLVAKQAVSSPEEKTKKAANFVASDPSILGKMHGVGFKLPIINIHLSLSKKRDTAIDLWHNNLSARLVAYDKSKELEQEFKAELTHHNYESKTQKLENDIVTLRHLLPDKFDQEFMAKIANHLSQEDNASASKIKILKESSIYSDAKLKVLQANTEKDHEEHKAFDVSVSDAIHRQTIDSKQHNPRLTFSEVKAKLSYMNNYSIFRQYALMINTDGKIEQQGNSIKCGSLHMDLDKGLWYRFSTQQKGDIFTLVSEATGASKYEALQIVAEKVGIDANEYNFSKIKDLKDHNTTQSSRAEKTIAISNEWVQIKDIASSTDKNNIHIFDPKKDLAFLQDKGHIENYYTYKNSNDQILGFTIRFVSSDTGDKQILPATYCHNEYLKKSAWRLKGFSDNGYKPIYGVEKIEQDLKPILIVEGEKTANIAHSLLHDKYTVISWLGGAVSASKADWQVLKDRDVAIWPDNDHAGMRAAYDIRDEVNKSNGFDGLCHIVDVKKLNLPTKWDLGDKLPNHLDKYDIEQILENTRIETSLSNTIISDKYESTNSNIEKKSKNLTNILSSNEIKNYVKYKAAKASYSSCHEFLDIKSDFYKKLLVQSQIKQDGERHNTAENIETKSPQEILKTLDKNFQNTINDYQNGKFGSIVTNNSIANQCKLEATNFEQAKLHEVLLRDATIIESTSRGSKLHDWHIDKLSNIITDIINDSNTDKDNIAKKLQETIESKSFKEKIDSINDGYKKDFQDKQNQELQSAINFAKSHFVQIKAINPEFDTKAENRMLAMVKLHKPCNHTKIIKEEISKAISPIIEAKINEFDEQRDKAKTAHEYLQVMRQEIKYSKFIGKKYANCLEDKSLDARISLSATDEKDSDEIIKNIGNTINHILSSNIANNKTIIKSLAASYNASSANERLKTLCHDHYVKLVDSHLRDIKHGHEIKIGDHKFTDPINYLEHQRSLCGNQHNAHQYMPVKYIDTTLNNYKNNHQKEQQELQKQQEIEKQKILTKDMGMSL